MTPVDAKEGFTFGCDPELFILDKEGKPYPAAGLIPGTKEEPFKVQYGAVQVDGMAAEFNIEPAKDFTEFNRNIAAVISQLEKMLPEGFTLSNQSSVRFDPAVFDAAPDIAKELGCSPDFNAWTGEVNPPPSDPDDPYLRCLGGHVHLGWTKDQNLDDPQHVMNCRDVVRQLDWYLGAWSLRFDDDPARRKLYGRAGACRYKDYGVEYRVLSPFWVLTRERRMAVWNRLQYAIAHMRNGFVPDRAGNDYNAMVQNAINTTTKDPYLEKSFRFPIVSTDASFSRY
jgi:hypothetical protein